MPSTGCIITVPHLQPLSLAVPQVMSRMTIALAVGAFLFVAGIFIALLARGEPVGYTFIVFFVVFVAVVPIGMPVVTTTVLAIGAQEMIREKAIVSR